MKTDELITLLATGAAPVPTHAAARRFAIALMWGLPGAVLLLLAVLGVRSDLAQAAGALMFWVKPAFAGSLALAGWFAAERLARPGVRLGRIWTALAAPLLLLWLVAAYVLLDAAPAQRAGLVFGSSWKSCTLNIALVSLPLFAATFWAVKGLAPTRLMLAGSSAGFLAGSLGSLVYTLYCPESTLPFMAVWYVLGIAIPTLAGAMLGPRLLRW
jgi:hypothetical protein